MVHSADNYVNDVFSGKYIASIDLQAKLSGRKYCPMFDAMSEHHISHNETIKL